jgi:hypothetical protein
MDSSDSEGNCDGDNCEILRLKVTKCQKQAVKEFFAKHHWEFIEADDEHNITHVCNSTEEIDPSDVKPGFIIKQKDTENECPFCLCRPCITDEFNRQLWWPRDPLQPNALNSKMRKKCYKNFWTMLYHREVWQDPRYKARKALALGLDPQRHRFIWIHKRDIIPDCVLKLVRLWYPNLPNVPYMGHMWE